MTLIRPATHTDLEKLSAFARKVFSENFGQLYRPDDLAVHLEKTCSATFFTEALKKNSKVLLACDGETIAGYAKLGAVGLPVNPCPERSVELHRLYIDKEFQGKGVGDALMREVLADEMVKSAAHVFVGVWEENFRAQRFYGKYGFVKVGEYKYFVGDTHYDNEFILRMDPGLRRDDA